MEPKLKESLKAERVVWTSEAHFFSVESTVIYSCVDFAPVNRILFRQDQSIQFLKVLKLTPVLMDALTN